jgi:hypothetical protein
MPLEAPVMTTVRSRKYPRAGGSFDAVVASAMMRFLLANDWERMGSLARYVTMRTLGERTRRTYSGAGRVFYR